MKFSGGFSPIETRKWVIVAILAYRNKNQGQMPVAIYLKNETFAELAQEFSSNEFREYSSNSTFMRVPLHSTSQMSHLINNQGTKEYL